MDLTDQRARSVAGVVALGGVATLLHLYAGYTFPRPWPDESHFLTPALTLVGHGRLAVPELNAPAGIFWMPTGYYLLQVPMLVLGAEALAAGRLLSLLGVVVFVGGAMTAAVRAGAQRAPAFGLSLVWLCTQRGVAIANIARMEGVMLACTGLCLWLTTRDRWPVALSLALAAPLVHPVGMVLAVAVAGAGLIRGRRRAWTRVERVLLVVVALLWIVQVGYFLAHAAPAAEHLRFQLTRKAGRDITLQWWQWLLLVATAAAGGIATWRWRRGTAATTSLWIALAVAGGFVLADVVGREMWYEVLGRESAVLLLGLVAAAALSRVPSLPRRSAAVAGGGGLAVVLVISLAATLSGGWYGMRPRAGSAEEWRAFAATAVGELQRLDAEATAPSVVLVDPLSGFGQELVGRSWRHLRFVQPTDATPAEAATADYLLVTPGAPFATKALVQGDAAPVVEVSSPRGIFRLQLFDEADAGG